MNPKPLLLAAVVSALIWGAAWCQLPGPQPAQSTPTVLVIVQPTNTVYVFTSQQPTVMATAVPERILQTSTHAVTQTAIPTQTAAPTSMPEPTTIPDQSRMRQRG